MKRTQDKDIKIYSSLIWSLIPLMIITPVSAPGDNGGSAIWLMLLYGFVFLILSSVLAIYIWNRKNSITIATKYIGYSPFFFIWGLFIIFFGSMFF